MHEDLGIVSPDHERVVASLGRGCAVRGFTVSSLYCPDWFEKRTSVWSDVERVLAAHADFETFCEARAGLSLVDAPADEGSGPRRVNDQVLPGAALSRDVRG
jgi:hypothetical protein